MTPPCYTLVPPPLTRLQTHQSLPPSHDAFLTIIQANPLGSGVERFFLCRQQRSRSTVSVSVDTSADASHPEGDQSLYRRTMSFGHQASAEPPCKRACLVAPKGSVANNPFRMLPGDVMAKIRVMKKLVPTPSANAIHEAGLRFEWRDGELEVSTIGRRGGGYFIVAAASMRMDDMRVRAYSTNLLEFSTHTHPGFSTHRIPGHDTYNPALGRVLSGSEETVLAYARYLAGHAPTAVVLDCITPPPPGDDWFSAHELHVHEQCLHYMREGARRWAHLFPPTR